MGSTDHDDGYQSSNAGAVALPLGSTDHDATLKKSEIQHLDCTAMYIMATFGWAEGRRTVASCSKTAGARNLRFGLFSIDCGPPQHATLKKSEIQHLDCTAMYIMATFGWAEGRRTVASCSKTAGARNLRFNPLMQVLWLFPWVQLIMMMDINPPMQVLWLFHWVQLIMMQL